jgi:N6-adenosine-specific RNA methylase IME4
MTQLAIAEIKIGKRHRKDLGDIDQLAKSINDVGLLHPVVVTPKNLLIAGQRRILACKKLEWSKIPITVVDLEQIVRGEFAENGQRKDFLPTETDAIRKAVEPLERAAAKERQAAAGEHGKEGGRGKKKPLAKVSPRVSGRATDKVGAFAGVSGRQVEKIKAVCEAAERDPKRFGHLPEIMDRTNKVGPAYSQVNRAQKHQKIHEKASTAAPSSLIITGPFPVIYADPPWKWGHFGEKDKENEAGKERTPDQHYPTLTYEEIEQFRIGDKLIKDIAAKDAALFLWCTSANFELALQVMKAWGFTYKSHAVWVKTNEEGKPIGGTGLVFRNMHEPLLYGTRGKMPGPQYQPPSVFMYPRGRHSAKPDEIRKAIEKMYPDFDVSTRLEMFARNKNAGWTGDGFESEG